MSKNKGELKYNKIEISKQKASLLLRRNMCLFIDNVITKMNEKKLSQSELAYIIRSERQHLNYILKSGNGITINVAGRIADALETNLCELFKDIK